LRFNTKPIAASATLALVLTGSAAAQDGSLLFAPLPQGKNQPVGLTLANSSFMHNPVPPESLRRELQERDIITVLVDYRSSMLSEGETQNRKTSSFDAVLEDWLGFDGKSIFAAPQRRGEPSINGQLNSQYRTNAELEVLDSLTFRIAATVVDIRPNGNLVIEANREFVINDVVWQHSLTGIVQRQAIGPDRTVPSDAIADLRIYKRELGQVREGYAPGWFARWYGKYKPF
jgi:flagellar L-ring protein FlgH